MANKIKNNKINICHLSDIHFGIYENNSFKELDENFSITDSLIEFITIGLKQDEKPHFLVISGDLTSESNDDEYEDFLIFLDNFIKEECFAKCYFDKYSEIGRTIIIPGNHDVIRELKTEEKYGSDKLKSFKRNITNKEYNTPYGNNKDFCFEIFSKEEGTEKTKKLPKGKWCPIPCAIYYYPEYNILFHSLVSCFNSHKYDRNIQKFYKKYKKVVTDINSIKEFEKDLEEIIYNDFGHFPILYRRRIRRTFKEFKEKMNISQDKYKNLIKLAVTHHQVVNLGSKYKNTVGAKETRESLGKNGVIAILHGHIHDVIDEEFLPKMWNGRSSFFSSGSISAYCRNAVNKFNMIEITNYKKLERININIMCYEINNQGKFSRTYKLYPNSIEKFLKSYKKLLY